MATVIPVDEFITDEWYPGFKPGYTHAPWYIDPVQTFRKEDEENFWFLDFHWPRGLTPMGLIWNEDGYNWSSQLAAEQMPLPPGRGITCRLGGTHTYGSPLPVTDVREIGQRARRLERMLPPFLQNFDEIGGHLREEANERWDYLRGGEPGARRGPCGRAGPGLEQPGARRDPGGAGRPQRRRRHLADAVRPLPGGLGLADRGLVGRRAAELDRGGHPGPGHDQDVPAEGHRP